MTLIYLIRHAEAEGNLYRRIHGWYDSLITDNGYRQIAALANRFEKVRIDAVYSSDLFRTCTTAGAIWKSHGLELHTRRDLREMPCGRVGGRALGRAGAQGPEAPAPVQSQRPGVRCGGGRDF